MIKPTPLKKGDKVAIVSLSRGLLGMPFCSHYFDLIEKRMHELGLEFVYMPHALKDMEFVKNNPASRAKDLKDAFLDKSIKGIFCAIGGDDTYKTLPYLLEDEEFIDAVKSNPKLFTGFSDTTINHLMFYKLGLTTFYGPAILTDFAEMDTEMLPYTKNAINYFFDNFENHQILSSDVWYEDRIDFSANALGTPRIKHKETHGYESIARQRQNKR